MEIGLTLLGGLAALIIGAELLVRGAVKVAERLGLSPLLIGLTLVGFGTSTPELVTSVEGALADSPGIAVGNVVGSNIANILLILGLTALIFPIAVEMRALRRDGAVMVLAAALLVLVSLTGALDRPVGIGFVTLLAGYLAFAYFQEKRTPEANGMAAATRAEAVEQALPHQGGGHARSAALDVTLWLGVAVLGLVTVIGGGMLFVDGAVGLARALGVSEAVIGLTIVAVGTSMPELITSTMAALRRQPDIALGNIFGSNIYNILGIAGVTGIIAPIPIPAEMTAFDIPFMIGVSVLLCALVYRSLSLNRVKGGVLLTGYAGYIAWLWP